MAPGSSSSEALDHAERAARDDPRGVVGYGATDDASHITLPAPGGRGAVESMRAAIADAGSRRRTSTTSTPTAPDAAERPVGDGRHQDPFGEDAYRVPISSTKSMTGTSWAPAAGRGDRDDPDHQDRHHPADINLENPDPECDLDYVPHEAREVEVEIGMSNSFGFGGHNATLVFRRYDGT